MFLLLLIILANLFSLVKIIFDVVFIDVFHDGVHDQENERAGGIQEEQFKTLLRKIVGSRLHSILYHRGLWWFWILFAGYFRFIIFDIKIILVLTRWCSTYDQVLILWSFHFHHHLVIMWNDLSIIFRWLYRRYLSVLQLHSHWRVIMVNILLKLMVEWHGKEDLIIKFYFLIAF